MGVQDTLTVGSATAADGVSEALVPVVGPRSPMRGLGVKATLSLRDMELPNLGAQSASTLGAIEKILNAARNSAGDPERAARAMADMNVRLRAVGMTMDDLHIVVEAVADFFGEQ